MIEITAIIPYSLKTEYLTNPLGIDVPNPRFSWLLKSETRGMRQYAYRVIVATSKEMLEEGLGDMWDSGKVVSDENIHIEYAGKKLLSSTRYWWQVRCYSHAEETGNTSETAVFETALLEPSDFICGWTGTEEELSSPIFRREFSLEKKAAQARAYICGLGYYEMYINGQKAGDHVLDPNWTDFDNRTLQDLIYPYEDNTRKRALYAVYDITSLLNSGHNAAGIMLGNGWYNQRERNVEGKMAYGKPKFWLQIHIRFEDGSEKVIGSGREWKYSRGPIVFNNIYYGEIYDARMAQKGWDEPEFEDASWQRAKEVPGVSGCLRAQMSPADKVISVIEPASRAISKTGSVIYDLGQNISGWARIRVCGSSGKKVELRFAEELDENGQLDYISSGSIEQLQKDVYILSGKGIETYEPHFTWHGFRYIEVTIEDGVSMESILGIVVHADVKSAGSFSCSNSLFNQIYEAYKWSQLSNLHGGVPSDCPHRERLGYTGDAQITAESAMFSFDMAAFYTKWLEDVDYARDLKSGYIPHTVPFYGGGGGPGGWGCAAVLLPWYMYLYYGDKRILGQHYEMMLAWMEYLQRHRDEDGIITSEEPGSWCLGEWVVPHQFDKVPGKKEGFNIDIPPELVNTYYYLQSATILSTVAKLLGDKEKECNFIALSSDLKKGMHKRFYNESTGSYGAGVQGCDVFPLAAGCVPKEKNAKVIENLLQNILERNGGHLDTGIFGTPLLLKILSDHGFQEIAYRIMNQRSYPGYGYMLSQGATTLWECWEKDQGSHNHPMFGSVAAWFFQYVAGLRIDENKPGFKKLIVRPCLFSDIDYAEVTYESIRGHIGIRWERTDAMMTIHLEIPCNCSADVYLPVKELERITERGIPIFQKEKLSEELQGITGYSVEEEGVKLTVQSGVYRFEWLA